MLSDLEITKGRRLPHKTNISVARLLSSHPVRFPGCVAKLSSILPIVEC